MSLRLFHDDIAAAWSALQAAWAQTRSEWRDAPGERFERENWVEWERAVPAYLEALEEISRALESSLRDE